MSTHNPTLETRSNGSIIIQRGFLALYIATLTWLVIFKLSFHISSLNNFHHNLNLTPFGAPAMINGRINYAEMVLNCLVFIPFGMLLSVNFKKLGLIPKLLIISAFSFVAELIQYQYSIGVADITDLITNTTGGLVGLVFYWIANRFIKDDKLDRIVLVAGVILLLLFLSIQISHHIHRRYWR